MIYQKDVLGIQALEPPRIFADMTDHEYNKGAGLSRSALKVFDNCPALYEYKYLSAKYVETETPAIVLGRLIHKLVLEPHKVEEEFFFLETKTLPRKGSKQLIEAVENANGRLLVSATTKGTASAIADSCLNDDLLVGSLVGARIENSVFWKDAETDILCKFKPDVWKQNDGIIVDLKTTINSTPRAFSYSALDYGYYLQAGMMHEGLLLHEHQLKQFCIITVEKKPPYLTTTFVMTEEAIQFGVEQFHTALRSFRRCQDLNKWPGYEMQMLGLPRFATINPELTFED